MLRPPEGSLIKNIFQETESGDSAAIVKHLLGVRKIAFARNTDHGHSPNFFNLFGVKNETIEL